MRNKWLAGVMISSAVIIAACSGEANESVETPSDLNDFLSQNQSNYSNEELLGKTIAEYELFLKEQEQREAEKQPTTQPKKMEDNGFQELSWDDLIAPGYDADSILEKYSPQIEVLEHNSDAALALYEEMNVEFNNAPANGELADKQVSIPGFIAPLEQVDGLITEFLLVPYFGACIHLPPPPANQTLYVKVAADYAIRNEDSYDPVWVSGRLNVDKTDTGIGTASYQIQNALISKYQ